MTLIVGIGWFFLGYSIGYFVNVATRRVFSRRGRRLVAALLFVIGFLLMFTSVTEGRTFLLLPGDPNDCVQADYRPVCPYTIVLDQVDPNAVVLPPVPGDPNTWELPAGWWRRPPAWACDPDPNDAIVSITVVASSTAVKPTVHHDPNAATWSFEAELEAGLNAFAFAATDRQGGTREAIVAVWGINRDPVLF